MSLLPPQHRERPIPRTRLFPASLLAGAAYLSLAEVLVPLQVRALFVLPVALLLPGYAIHLLVFDKRVESEVSTLASSVLLTMVLYPLLLIVLHALGIPITQYSVLAAVDTVVVGVALYLLPNPPVGIRAGRVHSPRPVAPAVRPRDWAGPCALLVIATGLIALSVGLLTPRLPAPAPGHFTEFYLTGRWAKVQGVISARPGAVIRVGLAVRSMASREEAYRIRVSLDDRASVPNRHVVVAPSHRWVGAFSVRVPRSGCVHRVELALFDARGHAPVQPLTLWLTPTATGRLNCATGPSA